MDIVTWSLGYKKYNYLLGMEQGQETIKNVEQIVVKQLQYIN